MTLVDKPLANFHTGDILSGYELIEIIGQGSSGTVWKAQSNQQSVAIKVMHPHLLKGKQSQVHAYQFHQEVEALATLVKHPRVPRLLAIELKARPPYFVMSLASGRSLEQEITSGRIILHPIKMRLEFLYQVAEIIDSIHQKGILHRDIKPDNIRNWQNPYLVDFSISSQISKLHEINPRHGTNLYKPPYPHKLPSIFDDYFAFVVVCFQVIFNRHPIMSPSELSDDLIDIMNQKLLSGTWYKPTQLPSAQIPVFLQGANLDMLDHIFTRAFKPETSYTNIRQLVDNLAEVILDSDNKDYVDLIPDEKNLPVELAQMLGDFTDNEISVNALNTDIQANLGCGQNIAIFIKPFLTLLQRFAR